MTRQLTGNPSSTSPLECIYIYIFFVCLAYVCASFWKAAQAQPDTQCCIPLLARWNSFALNQITRTPCIVPCVAGSSIAASYVLFVTKRCMFGWHSWHLAQCLREMWAVSFCVRPPQAAAQLKCESDLPAGSKTPRIREEVTPPLTKGRLCESLRVQGIFSSRWFGSCVHHFESPL